MIEIEREIERERESDREKSIKGLGVLLKLARG